MRMIIVSGRSGSGKSTALNVLEDSGYYCIDNLPAGLLPELAERALIHTELAQPLVAVSIDARNLPSHLSRFPELLAEVRNRHIQCDVLYLDADEETLLKRFSETRRRHPLSNASRSLAEAIHDESQLLGPIADLVFDVRCLPNPYWKPELREQSGLDQPVIDYLAAQPDVEEMYQDISSYLLKWLPRFAASNRAYVTIAIGCTGGHHRSVYLTERLGQLLQQSLKNVQVRHRDLS
ncbi:RapZ family nucleotide-binding protein [Pseudomonas sp. PICF6]|uniref:RapZ family nucleotide-binding protein n=1 Tax=Pseudomonas sp. PICF6 TaxID=2664172 RepID=UPI0013692F49|nr:RapZ family nucleotide-binding protein [Pseudomonas sp. PICF6]MXR31794.1 RNase adaptor protein RapZ [Pseudomonas sp. PICF6]